MRRALHISMCLVVGVTLSGLPAAGSDLGAYRWKSRLLLIFSPSASHPVLEELERILAMNHAEVIDRDLVIFRVYEDGPSKAGQQPLSPEDSEKLRRRYKINTGRLTVILIGKDGGIKLVRQHRADLQEIFDLIDSMPMRRQEMREKAYNR